MFSKDENKKDYVKIYVKSIIRGILVSAALLLISTIVFYFTKLNGNYMQITAYIISIIGICYSSIYGSYKIGKKGYLHGAFIGFIYMFLLSIIALLAEKGEAKSSSMLIMYVASIIIGMLSGMIGTVLCDKN
ncbi:MAG TPA: TIGR04086 family membrane protein [Clostridiaceae bacterium]|mgnify:CR=1 FL=1|jgi:putative membrane protein (TIGR04086 family)|nr:TIGR04086 family membrane protein [Clostridiaceae bacterium]HBF76530.1 TIGR04086 family membrane protein [Clostridiaceae bacterium]HBG39145.1 TIGR04086 family membrane protein [Clostridiaceae bacterium]HBN29094.1 TIGR04086 family membrane protein [Clostridiaceae bacterium]HBX48555.1 TIGR04086 family membrane protein [Clostridiaceae bacterium]